VPSSISCVTCKTLLKKEREIDQPILSGKHERTGPKITKKNGVRIRTSSI
jgi:hypothetical protein